MHLIKHLTQLAGANQPITSSIIWKLFWQTHEIFQSTRLDWNEIYLHDHGVRKFCQGFAFPAQFFLEAIEYHQRIQTFISLHTFTQYKRQGLVCGVLQKKLQGIWSIIGIKIDFFQTLFRRCGKKIPHTYKEWQTFFFNISKLLLTH